MRSVFKKYLHITSLRRKMILSFSALLISALAILQAANTYQTYTVLEENLSDSVHESLRLGLSNIDYFFEDINNLASGILPETPIQNALTEKIEYNSLETKSLLRSVEQTIKRYSSTRPYIPKVYLVNLDNQILDNSLQGMVVPIINEDTDNGSLNLSDIHDAPYISQHIPVISFAKNIYSLYSGNKKLGRLIIDIDTRVINQVLYDFSLPMKGEIFLLDNKNKLLSRSGTYSFNDQAFLDAVTYPFPSMDETISINHEKFLCLTETSALTGWTFCALIPYHMFAQSIIIQMSLTLILFIVCIFAAIIISRPIINSLYKPIGMLISSMKEVENGNLDSFVSYHNQDELLSLIDGYNSMLTQIRNLITQVKTKERSKRQAELYALQAQINPHFLYNTLNSIRYLAKLHNTPDIRDITVSLIHLSSASLSSDKFITISQELELVADYLHIQKVRYGEEVVYYHCQITSPDITEYLIPRFSIQPLIENALFHGILPKGHGQITVVLSKMETFILINIYDNGVGMSKEKISSLNNLLENDQYQEYSSDSFEVRKLKNIGIENINHRIKINFSNKFGINLSTNPSGGIHVQMKIPVMKEEGYNENSIYC